MPSAGKAGLGIGTAAAGGAASGAAFGPIGAGIGAGVGGLLGLLGAFGDSEEEEELKRRRDEARKMAVVEALGGRAAALGAPTDRLNMMMKQRGIDQQYQAGMDRLNRVGPQEYMGLLTGLASVGGKAQDWFKAPLAPTGDVVRNSDLYGTPDSRTGLDTDLGGMAGRTKAGLPMTMSDPMGSGAPSMTEDELREVSDRWKREGR